MDNISSEQLACKFCGKLAKSRSGNTNHEKICKKREGADVNISPSTNPRDRNPYDFNPNDRRLDEWEQRLDEREQEPQERNQERKVNSPKTNMFNIGAFLVMTDHIPILLHIDLCIALANHILENGSPNGAIMAFAHQLKSFDGD